MGCAMDSAINVLPKHRRHSAADRQRGVAVGYQRCNQRSSTLIGKLQDLQAVYGEMSFRSGLVRREGWLTVAGTGLEVDAVRAGGAENRLLDERRYCRTALEPGGERRHGEADVFGD